MSYVKSLLFGIGVVAALVGIAANSTTAHATKSSHCVDASKTSNLVFPTPGSNEWVLSGNKITGKIGLKGNLPACKDTTIYLSSYIMPDTWDQKSFPQTALPQTFIESQSITFKAKQATAQTTLTVSYPVPCKNVQVDLYYGPEKTTLDEQGHNGVYISHKFIKRDNEACKPRVTPAAPSVSDVCGTDKDTLTIPATEGVAYLLNGNAISAGTHPVTGSVTVTAQAASNQYVIASDVVTQWAFTLTDEKCPTPGQGGGSVDNSTPTTPQVLATSTATPATLPATGASVQQIVTFVASLVAFAYGVVYLVRAKLATNHNS